MHIQHVTMQAAFLPQMKAFYTERLQMALLSNSASHITLAVGASTITFTEAPPNTEPFYHFAMDVPSNQFEEAKAWLEARVPLSRHEGEDEVYFRFIDAKSIYFKDPAGNIVEFICRQSDAPPSDTPFSASSLQKVSEMSIVTHDKLGAAEALQHVSLLERDGEVIGADGLDFIGERRDATYLLLVNEGRRWFFSHKDATAYPVHIVLKQGVVVDINDALQLTCTTQ